MTIAIALSFPGGKFHATAWGKHVNEATPDWPPAPWRLLRAFVAVWKRTLDTDAQVNQHFPNVLTKLTAPPVYKLPPAVLAHTRHYLSGASSLVFDGFLAIAPMHEVGVCWPQADLLPAEQEALARVLAHMNYLGRAESWCAARLCADWDSLSGAPCAWVDDTTGEHHGDVAEHCEPVRLLSAESNTWNGWGYGRKAYCPDPKWNLLAETTDLHSEGWSDPPGSRWVTYLRPAQALSAAPARRYTNSTAMPLAHSLRFALGGPVLPRVADTVYVAELVRHRVQGIFGKLFDGAASATFSGRQSDRRLLDHHEHTFFLPTDDDGDGRLDHVVLFAENGFNPQEIRALDVWHATRGPGNIQMNVLWLGQDDPHWRLVGTSTRWRSITPFITTRHYKERGTKRDTFPRDQLAAMNLREELTRRGLPAPVRITETKEHQLAGGRTLNWRDFRQQRVLGDGRRGNDFGKGFEIEFAEPVAGPLVLGYACHFGLGLFAPVS